MLRARGRGTRRARRGRSPSRSGCSDGRRRRASCAARSRRAARRGRSVWSRSGTLRADGAELRRVEHVARERRPAADDLVARVERRLREQVDHAVGAGADDDLLEARRRAARRARRAAPRRRRRGSGSARAPARSIASSAAGNGGNGPSFDASLTTRSRPSSRCTSSTGLPGSYGTSSAIERRKSGAAHPASRAAAALACARRGARRRAAASAPAGRRRRVFAARARRAAAFCFTTRLPTFSVTQPTTALRLFTIPM